MANAPNAPRPPDLPNPPSPIRPPALFVLHRVSIVDTGAFGVLLHRWPAAGLIPFAVTLERTYLYTDPTDTDGKILTDGAVLGQLINGQLVKIPFGRYRCVPQWFGKGGYLTFEIIVPGHTSILFHRGNIEAHSEGCVLVAESFAQIGGPPHQDSGILDGGGLTELLKLAAGLSGFDLEVVP